MYNAPEIEITDQEFDNFRSLISQQAGILLKESKRALLRGRLMRRLRENQCRSFTEYYQRVTEDDPRGTELQEMINAITTNKTSFFREAHHFDCLRKYLLEPCNERQRSGQPISLRVWSAGCSSGEEPYSIAATIVSTLNHLASCDVKILASDIDTNMLQTARAGIYQRSTIEDFPEALVRQCFLKGVRSQTNIVRVKPVLQDLVTFAHLNLMENPWPFHGKFDAIFCRNVMIYFDSNTQHQLVLRFADYLKPGGLLLSGHSENLLWLSERFESIGHTAYQLRPQGR